MWSVGYHCRAGKLIVRFNSKKSLDVIIKYKVFNTSEAFEEWQAQESDPMCGQITIKDIVPLSVGNIVEVFVTYFIT